MQIALYTCVCACTCINNRAYSQCTSTNSSSSGSSSTAAETVLNADVHVPVHCCTDSSGAALPLQIMLHYTTESSSTASTSSSISSSSSSISSSSSSSSAATAQHCAMLCDCVSVTAEECLGSARPLATGSTAIQQQLYRCVVCLVLRSEQRSFADLAIKLQAALRQQQQSATSAAAAAAAMLSNVAVHVKTHAYGIATVR
jgi:hypothetical protein